MCEYDNNIIITLVGTQLNDGQLSCVLSYTCIFILSNKTNKHLYMWICVCVCTFVSLFHITLRQSTVIIIIIYDVYIQYTCISQLLYSVHIQYYNKKWLSCFAQNKTRLTYAKHNMTEWRRLYPSQCSSILMSSTVYNIYRAIHRVCSGTNVFF